MTGGLWVRWRYDRSHPPNLKCWQAVGRPRAGLAAETGLTERSLSRLFRRANGHTFRDFVDRIRVIAPICHGGASSTAMHSPDLGVNLAQRWTRLALDRSVRFR